MENPFVNRILQAIDSLTAKYGQPKIDGPERDWGQVVCRMRFGPHWGSHPEFLKGPTNVDLINCNRLERGEWPPWIEGCTKEE